MNQKQLLQTLKAIRSRKLHGYFARDFERVLDSVHLYAYENWVRRISRRTKLKNIG